MSPMDMWGRAFQSSAKTDVAAHLPSDREESKVFGRSVV